MAYFKAGEFCIDWVSAIDENFSRYITTVFDRLFRDAPWRC